MAYKSVKKEYEQDRMFDVSEMCTPKGVKFAKRRARKTVRHRYKTRLKNEYDNIKVREIDFEENEENNYDK